MFSSFEINFRLKFHSETSAPKIIFVQTSLREGEIFCKSLNLDELQSGQHKNLIGCTIQTIVISNGMLEFLEFLDQIAILSF
jgi:hypothetical protein